MTTEQIVSSVEKKKTHGQSVRSRRKKKSKKVEKWREWIKKKSMLLPLKWIGSSLSEWIYDAFSVPI